MEDSVLALNTGYWRTRDGVVIERGQGKGHLINPSWRARMDEVARLIGEVRTELRRALSLDQDLYLLTMGRVRFDDLEELLRWDGPLGGRIDKLRAAAIGEMNRCLDEAGLNRLANLGS